MTKRIGSSIAGGAIITPTRMPARPCAFENVRPTSTFGYVARLVEKVLAHEVVIRLVDEDQRVPGLARRRARIASFDTGWPVGLFGIVDVDEPRVGRDRRASTPSTGNA